MGVIFVLISGPVSANSLSNTLKDHPAPYLALHGDDPVAWQTWGEDVLELSRKENKILLLSVGYFSCHWCHVMQKESYQNPEVADLLNENFISVKIDRELEPALDRRLMDFTQRTIGRGGWPLNVFILPSGHPIYSVLYAPPGQFMQLLNQLQTVWQQDPERVLQVVKNEVIAKFPAPSPDLESEKFTAILSKSTDGIMSRADWTSGGFGESQKFPSAPQMRYLVNQYRKNPDEKLKSFIVLTLDAIASRGMHDHIAGGFFRYTTDRDWNIPHFEKMLYDNANLGLLYLEAASALDMPEFKGVSFQTLDFMQEQMWHKDGAFVSSFSAVDDENIEGGSYLWTKAQIVSALDSKHADLILKIWDLDKAPELPAGNHPRFVMSLGDYAQQNELSLDEVMTRYDFAIAKLKSVRLTRSLPVDDKLVAGWNGLALSAFVEAAKQKPESDYAETAKSLRNFLVERLWDGNKLSRSITKGNILGASSLEDYAYVAKGIVDWAEYVESEADLQLALSIVDQGWKRFYRSYGWYQGDATLLAPASGELMLSDAASASPSGILIKTSIKLARLFENAEMEKRALSALNRGDEYLSRAPFWYVSQLQAIDHVLE